MIDFICLFFPAVVSLGLHTVLRRRLPSVAGGIFRYVTYGVVINLLGFLINEYVLFDGAYFPFVTGGNMDSANGLVYLAVVAVLALLIPIFEIVFLKNITITVEEDTDETP